MTIIRLAATAALLASAAACSERGNQTAPTAPTANAAAPKAADVTAPAGTSTSSATAWQTTRSGLRYRRIAGNGAGPKPRPTDTVTIHYVGRLTDGTEFDSSFRSGSPVTMALPDLIPGWQEGVPLMGVGDVYEFLVPPELGYGAQGGGPIPPNSTLHFTIGLLDIG